MATSSNYNAPDIARWRSGNTGVEGAWRFDSGRAGRHVLVTALLHGNEFSGAQAVVEMLESGLRPLRGTLTLAFCNLDAFDTFDPAHPDRARFVDEDMNRVWTTERLDGPPSREQRRAKSLLPFVRKADWLLDLHSMHEPCEPLLLTGPDRRNIELARRLGAPRHVVVDHGHADGCRLRDFEQFGTGGRDDALALLLEAGYHFDPSAKLAALDAVARFLALSGIVEADALPAGWRRPTPHTQVELVVTQAVVAQSTAFRFVEDFKGLEVIARAGTVIGHDGDTPVITPHDGCVLVMPSLRQLRPGVTVVRLALNTSGSETPSPPLPAGTRPHSS